MMATFKKEGKSNFSLSLFLPLIQQYTRRHHERKEEQLELYDVMAEKKEQYFGSG